MSFEYTLDADCHDGWFMEHTLEFMLCFLALGIAFFSWNLLGAFGLVQAGVDT
jgi:hypothetical protein